MKITILCHSDSLGGAAIVSRRLLDALLAEGVDARMLVVSKGSDHPQVAEAGHPLRFKAAFLAEHADIFLRSALCRTNLFRISTAKWGLPLADHPWVAGADAVVLAWVNQGMISLGEIARIKAPVAWVMHDMWNLTGICHHAARCKGYLGECGSCPLLGRAASPTDLSHSVWLAKKALYDAKPIRFVAVSHWLAERCAEARLMQGRSVTVIPNAFDLAAFRTSPLRSRAELGLPEHGKLIVMAAARLDDPIKGLPLAIEALNSTHGAAAVFAGELRNPDALASLKIPYVHLGAVPSGTLADVYAHAHAVLSSSSYETLPGTLVEGIASGALAVTFGQGGQADIVDHGVTGYIARYPSVADLAAGLNWALGIDPDRAALRASMQRFAPQSVARAIISLFT